MCVCGGGGGGGRGVLLGWTIVGQGPAVLVVDAGGRLLDF